MARKESAARNLVPPPLPSPDGKLRIVPKFPGLEADSYLKELARKDAEETHARAEAEEALQLLRRQTREALDPSAEQVTNDEMLADVDIQPHEVNAIVLKDRTAAHPSSEAIDPTAEQVSEDHILYGEASEQTELVAEDPMRAEMVLHEAMAAAALYRSADIRHTLRMGQNTGEDWEYLTRLRSDEIDMQDALAKAWKRPEAILHEGPATDERRVIIDALDDINQTLTLIRERMATKDRSDEERAREEAAKAQAEAEQAAARAQIEEIEATVDMSQWEAAERKEAEDKLKQIAAQTERQIHEQELISIDVAWDDATPEEAAHVEEAAKTNAEAHQAIHQIERIEADAAQQPESPTPEPVVAAETAPRRGLWENVRDAIAETRKTMDSGNVDDDRMEQLLENLSKQSNGLARRLEQIQLKKKMTREDRKEMEWIADTQHLMEDMRHDLHDLHLSPQERINDRLERRAFNTEADIAKISIQQKKLAKDIERQFGADPETIIALGGLGIRQSLKGLLAKLAGKEDVLAAWKELERRRQELEREQSPALISRSVNKESEGKAGVLRGEAENMERERISQRKAASDWRETQGLNAAETEDAFFGGSLEKSEHPEVYRPKISDALEFAEARGVNNAEEIYRRLNAHPFADSLSFSPQEYVRQLGLLQEALAEQGGKKGADRRMAKRRLEAIRTVLQPWESELLEYGINPRDGVTIAELPAPKKTSRRKK